MEIRSIPGRLNIIADWLSRCDYSPVEEEIDMICVPTGSVNMAAPHFAPFVPTRQHFVDSQSDATDEERKMCCLGNDGLLYSLRSGKLFVPKSLREAFMFWFHASRYGSHMGVGRTVRRMSKWVYWPKMKRDVAEYIGSCLVCKRTGNKNVPYLRDVLSRPVAGQMISIDHVGPREWSGMKWWYIVVVDHATRFMVVRAVKTTSTAEVLDCLRQQWVPILGVPESVLVDHGSSFTSAVFRKYMLQTLNCMIIYTSVHYPQGNAINEASHKGIEAALKARALYDQETSFDEALQEAVLAYNCTPHSAFGQSPAYMMLGMELALPGWQRYNEKITNETRLAILHDLRARAMMKAVLKADEHVRLFDNAKYSVGDWVVVWDNEVKGNAKEPSQGQRLVKYLPDWSAPVKIIEVKNNCVIVSSIKDGKPMQVPLRNIRKVVGEVPQSLQQLQLKDIHREAAQYRVQPEWQDRKRQRIGSTVTGKV
eukprot:Lankesteria_metandrocarpae@DN5478_c0_g1_i3.p2